MAWSKVVRGKTAGGLGFKEIISFNLAMLTKVRWRLICNPNSLLAKTIHAKYYSSSSFLEAPNGKGTSCGWKGILQGWQILKRGLRWRVGDSRSIWFQTDPWLPIHRTFLPISRSPEMPHLVRDLVAMDGTWKMDVVQHCFNSKEACVILSLPLSRFGWPDLICWHYTRNGIYSVKSGYKVA